MSESASVLDGLAARLERLVDATEAPQDERAVGERGCFRVVQIDQRGLSILGRIIERLPSSRWWSAAASSPRKKCVIQSAW